MKLHDQRPSEPFLDKHGRVRIREKIVVVKVHEVWLVTKHFSHYRLRVMIVAERQKRRKPEPNRKNFDRADVVQLVNLIRLYLLVKSVQHRVYAFSPVRAQVLR